MTAPIPPSQAQASDDPKSGSRDGNLLRQEFTGSQPVGSCSCRTAPYFLARAHQLPAQNLRTMYQELYLKTTATTLALCSTHSHRGSVPPAVWLVPSPTSCPHQSTRSPLQPSLPPSVAQIRSPAPARTEQSLLGCCPASCESICRTQAGSRAAQQPCWGQNPSPPSPLK